MAKHGALEESCLVNGPDSSHDATQIVRKRHVASAPFCVMLHVLRDGDESSFKKSFSTRHLILFTPFETSMCWSNCKQVCLPWTSPTLYSWYEPTQFHMPWFHSWYRICCQALQTPHLLAWNNMQHTGCTSTGRIWQILRSLRGFIAKIEWLKTGSGVGVSTFQMDTLVIRIPHPQRLVSFTKTMLFAKTARIEETNGGNCQERQKKKTWQNVWKKRG